MILKQVIIKNFRGYAGEHKLDVEKGITALIGKNDSGKSTILEALDIFFNDSKPELEDLNMNAGEREILIGCVFDELPTSITVDSSATTTLAGEYLLNNDGYLEVVKRFSCTDRAISKAETNIRAAHPTADNYNDLLSLKLADLKTRGSQLGVVATDQRVNSLWRAAIWQSAGDLAIDLTELKIEELDTKVKSIYTNLESLFPQFFIFRVDRQTTDADAEAKDPIQLAVKEAQKEYSAEIIALQDKIEQRVIEVTESALAKLKEMDATLADRLTPVLKTAPKWAFDYKIQDERGVALNKRGSGTRRLVLLNFFRAEAEKKSSEGSGNIIYAIEEPETSQHPNNQKLIIDSLLELADDSKRQVLITTHSPQLLEVMPQESVRLVEFDQATNTSTIYLGADGLQRSADSLGILANQKFGGARAVVLVEGEADETFLNHASRMLAGAGKISSNLTDAKITILPAGGCDNARFWIQKMRLESLGLPYAVFVDSDRKSLSDPATKNEVFCTGITTNGGTAYTTRKREVENYIDLSISNATYGDYDDAKNIIALANSIRDAKVMTTFWPTMTAEQIITQCAYTDEAGTQHHEIVDIINGILKIAE